MRAMLLGLVVATASIPVLAPTLARAEPVRWSADPELIPWETLATVIDGKRKPARSLKEIYGRDAVGIFVVPPSFAALESRLRARGTDSEDQIARRLRRVRVEMEAAAEAGIYDYRIVNEDRTEAARAIDAIVAAERLRLDRLREMTLS